ncbi:MAG: hypothetical protein II520_04425, partial [Bacilli bacterium]|nr:hypothetical protein [Bacilli bacterium]
LYDFQNHHYNQPVSVGGTDIFGNAAFTDLTDVILDAYFDAAMAYPMHFSDVDLTAKYDEILSRFLGKTGYASLAAMSGAYGGFQKISDLKGWFAGL